MLKYILQTFQFLVKSNFSAEAAGEPTEASKDPLQIVEDMVASLEKSLDGDDLEALEEINNQRDAAFDYVEAHTQSDRSKLQSIMAESFGESLAKGMGIKDERGYAAFQAALTTVNPDFVINIDYPQLSKIIQSGEATLTYNSDKNVVGVYTDVQNNTLDELAAVISSDGTVKVYDGTNDGWNNPLNDNEFDGNNIKDAIDDMQERVKTADAADNGVELSAVDVNRTFELERTGGEKVQVTESADDTVEQSISDKQALAMIRIETAKTQELLGDDYTLQIENGQLQLVGNGNRSFFTIENPENETLLKSDVAIQQWIGKRIDAWEGENVAEDLTDNFAVQEEWFHRYVTDENREKVYNVLDLGEGFKGNPEVIHERVTNFQKSKDLKDIDGILGPDTLAAIMSEPTPEEFATPPAQNIPAKPTDTSNSFPEFDLGIEPQEQQQHDEVKPPLRREGVTNEDNGEQGFDITESVEDTENKKLIAGYLNDFSYEIDDLDFNDKESSLTINDIVFLAENDKLSITVPGEEETIDFPYSAFVEEGFGARKEDLLKIIKSTVHTYRPDSDEEFLQASL